MIRRVAAADSDQVAALRRAYAAERRPAEAGTDPGFEARLDRWFQQTEGLSVCWIACHDASAIGLLSMFVIPRMPVPGREAGKLAYLGLLFVLPEHRNRGLGRSLLESAFDYARQNDVTKILLRSTEAAVGLYRQTGFETADRYLVWNGS